MTIKRKIDQLLAKSNGMQLVWLMGVSALCLGVALIMAYFVYDDAEVKWQTVVAIFLDPGCFGGVTGHHDFFRLIIALLRRRERNSGIGRPRRRREITFIVALRADRDTGLRPKGTIGRLGTDRA